MELRVVVDEAYQSILEMPYAKAVRFFFVFSVKILKELESD